MIVKIVDNKSYRSWAWMDDDLIPKRPVHYFLDEVFEVIPYRHNPNHYYEVKWSKLSSNQKLLCPKVDVKTVFWIDKTHTTELVYELPEELFKI